MKSKWVFFLHQSPPIHGAAIVGDAVAALVKSKVLGAKVFNLSMHAQLSQHAKLKSGKLITLIILCVRVFQSVIAGSKCIYYTPSVSKIGVFKDLIILVPFLILKKIRPADYKIVFHVHSAGLEVVYEKSSFLFRWLMRQMYHDCYFIALCEFQKRRLSVFGQESFILFNHAPSNTTEHVNKAASCDRKEFLFLSNMYRSKGIFDAINFFEKLDLEGKRLKIAGPFIDGECSEDELRHFIESKSLSQCVEILGPVYGPDKEQLLEACDVLIFPTQYHNEMFPLVILEALAHGCYIITLPTAGIPEIINEKCLGDMKFDLSTRTYLETSWQEILDYSSARRKYVQEQFSKLKFDAEFQAVLEQIDNDC